MTTDWPDWQPHPHMALAQYTQRIPLARNSGGIGNGNGFVPAGGSVNLVSGVTTDQPSFHMLINLATLTSGVTVPFGRLKFLWTDSASGFQVDPDWAVLPGGFGTPNFAYVSGPAKADTLTVELDNLDPAAILSYGFGISTQSQVYNQFRVEELTGATVFGFTRPGLQPQLGNLGSMSPLLAASGHADRLAMAWGGPAILALDDTVSVVGVLVQLLDPGVVLGTGALYAVASSGVIAALTSPGETSPLAQVSLPFGPVVIRETNLSASASVQPTTTLMRLPV